MFRLLPLVGQDRRFASYDEVTCCSPSRTQMTFKFLGVLTDTMTRLHNSTRCFIWFDCMDFATALRKLVV